MQYELSSLDRLLTQEKLDSMNRLLDVITDMDKVGILDVIKGILEDEDTLGKIIGSLTENNTLSLISNWNKLIYLINNLIDENSINNIQFIFNLIDKMKKSGVIDPIMGLLEDEEYLGKIINAIINDKTLSIIGRWDNILTFLSNLTDEETLTSVTSLIELIKSLNKRGLLDPIKGLLNDEEYLGKIINAIINNFTLNLFNHWEQIVRDLKNIDLENFKYYTLLVSATGEALKTENVKPITSIWEIYKLLKDPDIQRGLGVAVSILKHIGKLYTPEKGLAFKVEQLG
ncbi:MAG: DUF1641 domain-containing protein [Saccharolobus sp.]|jgi:uncharacterized protein YjgD (DUF1641 family)|uniref:DUF1641 domain-containing protein n=1 Tax=Saccharolobus sp. TaxID=2100761 RepID=UPI0028CDB991|nr:DUF1641 domain-containing protein [Saccharolobus sp.]MDT7861710.1 DUF1641 domain-containing protein [Saccharolobus sp.]